MRIFAIVVVVASVLVACGGGGGGGGPTEAPIKLTSTGPVNNAGQPATSITIPSGGRVHFFNTDTVTHTVSSSCTELNVGDLAAGADSLRPTMTGSLNCTYTDTARSTAVDASVAVLPPSSGGGGGGGGGGSGY
jgi:hypothetical protein